MKIVKVLLAVLVSLYALIGDTREVTFEKKKISIGKTSIEVEIADTDGKSSRGLMFRKTLAKDAGMLFIFEGEEVRSFWMKNTFVDLDIGFFSADKTLVDIQTMKAVKSELVLNPPSYMSAKPAMYALEMNAGWFSKNKIKIGAKLGLK